MAIGPSTFLHFKDDSNSSCWRSYCICQVNSTLAPANAQSEQSYGPGTTHALYIMWLLDYSEKSQILVRRFHRPDNRASVDAHVKVTLRPCSWPWHYSRYTSQTRVLVCNNKFPFAKHLRISVVYGLRQVTNTVICGQPKLYVMENILLPSRITFLNTVRFLTMASIRTTLSLFLLELWRQTVLT